MNLTEHFSLEEFTKGFRGEPTGQQLNNIYLLCVFGLEGIRERFGIIRITSGLRDVEHNQSVGGSSTSQHLTGEAADLWCPAAGSMRLVWQWCIDVLDWKGELFFYAKRGHLHIGLPRFGLCADQKVFENK